MTETTRIDRSGRSLRWQLLATSSAAALLAAAFGTSLALAADGAEDRSQVWIELGGQFEQFGGQAAPLAPPFVTNTDWAADKFLSPIAVQKMRAFSLGEEGSLTFQPHGSDWVFSASLRYGRSHGRKFLHQQTPGLVTHYKLGTKSKYRTAPPDYAQTTAGRAESHLIVDFKAGKDVGLGMFGSGGSSTVNLGVRFATFTANSSAIIRARPDAHFVDAALGKYEIPFTWFHEFYATAERSSSFHGVGPSISWNASAMLAGTQQAGGIALDWGVNASLLFGRQKARTHHQSSGMYQYRKGTALYNVSSPPHPIGTARDRSVTVPNVGGFAGVSYRYASAKISLGYRADFFFGAMDTGLDTRDTTDISFHGPFATISVGLGG